MKNPKESSNSNENWQFTVFLGVAFILAGLYNLIRFLKTGCVATRYGGLVCNISAETEYVTDVGMMIIGALIVRLGLKRAKK